MNREQRLARGERMYAVYKGDVFLDMGSVSELTERLHIKESTLWWMASPSAIKRRNGRGRNAVFLGYENDNIDIW